MRLYLVRHAIAEEPSEATRFADELRPLTARGRRRFKRSARRFAALDEPIDAVYSGPALRCVQTAEILAGALGLDDVRVIEQLRSDAAAQAVVWQLDARKCRGAALVGHKRHLTDLVAWLAAAEPLEAARLRMRRGAIVRIDARQLDGRTSGTPRWWIGPRGGALHAGLPGVEAAP